MKVAVIGAGLVGASVSFRLSQLGVQVVIIDVGQPGQGTSGSSFGWVNASSKESRPPVLRGDGGTPISVA